MRRNWPLIVVIGLSAAAAGCSSGSSPHSVTEVEPHSNDPPWFQDVTRQVGLNFMHECAPSAPAYFMPKITGSGAAAFDFDGDGRLDIYLIQNGGPQGAKNRLFHQEPDGTFRDVSDGSGLDVAGYGQGVAIGDVNDDGRPDVLLTEFGATRLFLNEGGGHFREVTREAGIDNPRWATSAAFFDFDRDGHLDFVVTNYLDFDPAVACGGSGRNDFCGPNSFRGTVTRLYRNLGPQPGAPGVRFEDVTLKAGLIAAMGKGLGVLCADFNGDGWPDIFVANDMMANHLWINRRDGTFKEEALTRGVAYTGTSQSAANMGIAWADVDGDGLPDLFVTHITDEMHTLWRQGPRGFFQDRTVAAGLTVGWRSTGFGAALVDFDRNGWPDLAYVNGAVYRNRGADMNAPFWTRYAQRNQLFANDGNGKFRDISESNLAFSGDHGVRRGLVVADFDNDGAPDLLLTEIDGPARLLRNVAPPKGHWLAISARMAKQRRDAYGAEITVRANGRSFWRLLNPGFSYCCSNDPRVHFGLGQAERYESIIVAWPDGSKESFAGGAADRQLELRQGEGEPLSKGTR